MGAYRILATTPNTLTALSASPEWGTLVRLGHLRSVLLPISEPRLGSLSPPLRVSIYRRCGCTQRVNTESYSALYGSTSVLEHILCDEECDVDPVNNVGRETPLHFALQLKDRDVRRYIVRNLLEAGADRTYVAFL